MSHSYKTTRSSWPRLILAGLILAGGASAALAQSPEQTKELAKLKADCRTEGEYGGLTGADLDGFVEDCVKELMAVEIHNTHAGE